MILSPKDGGGPGYATTIEMFRRQHGRCIAKFQGINSISEAEKYIGSTVEIPAGALPPPERGSFYASQLRGCNVVSATGEYIGTVSEVLESGGTEILKVDSEQSETLIPFAEVYLRAIDVKGRRIEVDLPEGLRDLNK